VPLASTERPEVTGTARVGSLLGTSSGSWSGAPASYSYQWLVDGYEIPGATSSTYILPPEVAGHRMSARVTVRAPGAPDASAESTTTGLVTLAALRVSKAPLIQGKARVGRTLRVTPGRVVPGAVTTTYRWLRGGKAVADATGSTYRITRRDRGRRVSVRVTYTRPGYGTATIATHATVKISPAPR
jgi:hypothetical protein